MYNSRVIYSHDDSGYLSFTFPFSSQVQHRITIRHCVAHRSPQSSSSELGENLVCTDFPATVGKSSEASAIGSGHI